MQNIISGFNAKSKGKGLTIYDNPLGVDNLILDHGTEKDAGPRGIVKGSGSVNLGGSVMGISSTNSGRPIRASGLAGEMGSNRNDSIPIINLQSFTQPAAIELLWEKSTEQRNPSTLSGGSNLLVEKALKTKLNMDNHSAVIFVENQDPN